MSHEYYSAEEGETEEDKERRYYRQAEKQLYEEDEIGFCGTDEDFRRQRKAINKRAQEIKEKEREK